MTVSDLIQGHTFQVAYSKQSAAGTPATTYDFITPMYGGMMKPMQDIAEYEVADGDPYRPGRFKRRLWGSGTIEFAAFPDSAARLLTAHLGTDTKTGAGDPWTHTMTGVTALPEWMTFWVRRPLNTAPITYEWDRYDDCIVKSVDITYGSGELLKLSCEILALTVTKKVSAPTGTASPLGVTNILDNTGPWYTWVGSTLKLDFSSTPATTAVHNFENWTFHVGFDDAELVFTDSLGASFRDIGQWKIGLTGDFVVQDWALMEAVFFGGSSSSNAAASASVPQGSIDFTVAVGPTADANRTMQILAPALNFDADMPDVDVSGKGLRASLTATLTKPASGAPLTIKVKNGINAVM